MTLLLNVLSEEHDWLSLPKPVLQEDSVDVLEPVLVVPDHTVVFTQVLEALRQGVLVEARCCPVDF